MLKEIYVSKFSKYNACKNRIIVFSNNTISSTMYFQIYCTKYNACKNIIILTINSFKLLKNLKNKKTISAFLANLCNFQTFSYLLL